MTDHTMTDDDRDRADLGAAGCGLALAGLMHILALLLVHVGAPTPPHFPWWVWLSFGALPLGMALVIWSLRGRR